MRWLSLYVQVKESVQPVHLLLQMPVNVRFCETRSRSLNVFWGRLDVCVCGHVSVCLTACVCAFALICMHIPYSSAISIYFKTVHTHFHCMYLQYVWIDNMGHLTEHPRPCQLFLHHIDPNVNSEIQMVGSLLIHTGCSANVSRWQMNRHSHHDAIWTMCLCNKRVISVGYCNVVH